ncbi:MAG TPA: phytanoyl-CoA dioxygenase family protein [Polymorphobacter sp.]|nr:phytanoyl-CoA dioxygenase family protein [Polymorphobacter sp.]
MATAQLSAFTDSPPRQADIAAARQQLDAEGWCVLADVIDADATRHALDRLHAAAAESQRQGLPIYMPELDPNPHNIRVFFLLERDAVFRELILHPDAITLVTALIGDDFLISNFTANIARPGARSMPLHSDLALVVPEPWTAPWSINIIWCLTDVSFENGATLFIPGSQHWQTQADVPDDALQQLRPFTARAGSIVAMDGRIWHTSGANITADQDRALLFGYYTKPFLRPQINWNAGLSAATQAALDPELHDRLGMGVTANAREARRLLDARRITPAGDA